MRKHPKLNTHMHIPLPMLSSNSVKMGPKNAIPHAHTHTHTPVIRHHSNQQKQCKKTTLIVSKTIVTQLENGFLATTTSPKTGVCPPMLDSQGCPSLHPGVLIGQVNGVKKIHEILGKQLCCLELRSRKGREKWVYWRSLFGKSGATTIFQSKKKVPPFLWAKV